MGLFTSPTSFRANSLGSIAGRNDPNLVYISSMADPTFQIMKNNHPAHPDLGHLILLVFEAVLEVVCVSLPGYIVARQGMFDAEMQKFTANLVRAPDCFAL
jgi:auxin efflux carrier family protein